MAWEAEIFYGNRVYHQTEGKVPKTENFRTGAEPGAPDAGRNMV